MPLIGVPSRISAEFLYQLARMGHGDLLVIADSNFPSDSVAKSCTHPQVIRVSGSTADVLADVLKLFPLDSYDLRGVRVMDRVQGDKDRNLLVPAYEKIANAASLPSANYLCYMDRFDFYNEAKRSFLVVQTDDSSLYANIIISKGVIA